jgi:hypothetical protein
MMNDQMVDDEATPKRKRIHPLALVTPCLLAAAVCAGTGATLTSRYDKQAAIKLATDIAADRKQEREAAASREAHLNELLQTERRDNEKDAQLRQRNHLDFARHAGRVRSALEADLSRSRTDNDACTGRIARIAEDYGDVDDLLRESVGLLAEGKAEIARLEGENKRLSRIAAGWQQRYALEHAERITVTAKKGS